MENLIELNNNEIVVIGGGHDGTAYEIGESFGSFCREVLIGWFTNKAIKRFK